MAIAVRAATTSDVDEIARVHVETWRSAYRGHMPDDYLDALDAAKRAAMWARAVADPNAVLLVAERQSRIAGFCSFVPARDADAAAGTGEIAALYVAPDQWRAGIGRALVEAVVGEARHRKCLALTLWVLEGNTRARLFYETVGFRLDGAAKTEQRPGFTISEVRYRRDMRHDL